MFTIAQRSYEITSGQGSVNPVSTPLHQQNIDRLCNVLNLILVTAIGGKPKV